MAILNNLYAEDGYKQSGKEKSEAVLYLAQYRFMKIDRIIILLPAKKA